MFLHANNPCVACCLSSCSDKSAKKKTVSASKGFLKAAAAVEVERFCVEATLGLGGEPCLLQGTSASVLKVLKASVRSPDDPPPSHGSAGVVEPESDRDLTTTAAGVANSETLTAEELADAEHYVLWNRSIRFFVYPGNSALMNEQLQKTFSIKVSSRFLQNCAFRVSSLAFRVPVICKANVFSIVFSSGSP